MFEKFQVASAVLKDQEKDYCMWGEMTRARDTALREDIDQDLKSLSGTGKWHDAWLAKHKASPRLGGRRREGGSEAFAVGGRGGAADAREGAIVSKVPGKDCLTVTGEVSALSVLAEQFVAAECRVEQSWGYGGFDKAPMTQSIKLEPSHGRHVAQVTFNSLTFGGWERSGASPWTRTATSPGRRGGGFCRRRHRLPELMRRTLREKRLSRNALMKLFP